MGVRTSISCAISQGRAFACFGEPFREVALRRQKDQTVPMFDMTAGMLVFHIVAIIVVFGLGYFAGMKSGIQRRAD